MNKGNDITLECIDGMDDSLKIPLQPDGEVRIGGGSADGTVAVKVLKGTEGHVSLLCENGRVYIECIGLDTESRLNGKPLTDRKEVRANDVIRIGTSIWRVNLPQPTTGIDQALFKQDRLHSIVGLEQLRDFRIRDIFSEVFKRKTVQEMEDQLLAGTSRHKPALIDFEVGWARPWLFSRFMLATMFIAVVMYLTMRFFDNNSMMLPGVMMVGAFAMPLSVLIYFMEMNTPRNISIFAVMSALFAGGAITLTVTLLLFERFDIFSRFIGASSAGIIEEVAKMFVVIAVFGRSRTLKWGQNGMLLGAAIGCGFTAFENAGYAFTRLLQSNFSMIVFADNMMTRASHAAFTHIVWTSNAAAALWFVKGDRPFSAAMLKDGFFLRIFASSMVLHMLWNAPVSLMHLPLFSDLKFVLLGLTGLTISLRLVQKGLKQVAEARQVEVDRMAAE